MVFIKQNAWPLNRGVAVFILCCLTAGLTAAGSNAGGKCRAKTPYYFSEFNPSSWLVEKEVNYEEVYRNYEYFEIFFNDECDEIVVKKYKKGELDSIEKFRIRSDGFLEKKDDGKS